MIAEAQKQAVRLAIEQIFANEQLENEAAFKKITASVAKVLLAPAAPRHKAGFMEGSVRYLTDDWDAPLPDTDWNAHA